jgi:hypothetical protein
LEPFTAVVVSFLNAMGTVHPHRITLVRSLVFERALGDTVEGWLGPACCCGAWRSAPAARASLCPSAPHRPRSGSRSPIDPHSEVLPRNWHGGDTKDGVWGYPGEGPGGVKEEGASSLPRTRRMKFLAALNMLYAVRCVHPSLVRPTGDRECPVGWTHRVDTCHATVVSRFECTQASTSRARH